MILLTKEPTSCQNLSTKYPLHDQKRPHPIVATTLSKTVYISTIGLSHQILNAYLLVKIFYLIFCILIFACIDELDRKNE